MAGALGWGALAAFSLVLGALIGLARRWPERTVGLVLGFGAGALISAVSFELAEEGVKLAGGLPVAIGLAVGALTYFVASGRVAAMGGGRVTSAAGCCATGSGSRRCARSPPGWSPCSGSPWARASRSLRGLPLRVAKLPLRRRLFRQTPR